MLPIPDEFEFDYFGSDLVYGRECVASLAGFLEGRGFDRAMIVTGTTVGRTDAVMDPIRAGIGGALAGVFAETTPEKSAETVYDGIDAMAELDADALVAVGGGSSMDVARQISAYAGDGRPLSAFKAAAREGTLAPPDPGPSPTPVVVIPTTLAGADISNSGHVAILSGDESPTGETIRLAGPIDPVGLFYDPSLVETTPEGILTASAMNGFDKAVETVYANNGSPITDGTAVHSLRLFAEALPGLVERDRESVDRAVVANILAQFRRRLSVIHAFGHGVSRHHPVHQGLVHAVIAPHALRYIFDRVDAKRELLAIGFGADPNGLSPDDQAAHVVDAVAELRDSLGLPRRLRDLDGVPEAHIPMIAALTLEDAIMSQAPDGLDPTVEELEAVLHDAW